MCSTCDIFAYISIWVSTARSLFEQCLLCFIMLYTSPSSRFEITTYMVIGTDCIGSCKSHYHTITATTAPDKFCYTAINTFTDYIKVYPLIDVFKSNLQNITDSSLVHISTEMALSIVRNTIIFNSIYLLLLLYLCIQLLVFFHRGPKPTYLCFIWTTKVLLGVYNLQLNYIFVNE
jgi:hypothetical protein